MRGKTITNRIHSDNPRQDALALPGEISYNRVSDRLIRAESPPEYRLCMLSKCALALASSFLIATLCNASDQLPADTGFIRRAEQAANQEAADAQSALQMSGSPAVKSIAAQIQRDANATTQRLSALSIEKGWPSRSFGAPDTMSVYSDHDYITRQIRAQRNVILLYREEAANGADSDLQGFARQTLQILQRNLDAVRSFISS